MKKMLELRALQTLRGDEAATAEILRALRKTKGNMRKACELLNVGKSSMYRLIEDLKAEAAIDELMRELGTKVQGKVLTESRRTRTRRSETPVSAGPRMRVKKAAA